MYHAMIARWCLLLALVLFLPHACDAVRVGQVTCGGTIPIDSNFLLDPSWSLSPHRDAIQRDSGTGISFSARAMSSGVNSLIESEAGADPSYVTLFQLANDNAAANCTVFLNPLKSGLAGRVASSIRLVALGGTDTTSEVCAPTAILEISSASSAMGSLLITTTTNASSVFAHSASFPVTGSALPLSVVVPSGCQVQLLVLVSRAGSIKPWYVWIPTTVYSGLVTLIVVPHLFFARSTPAAASALIAVLVFVGYLGSMIGLIVEVICWQSSLGRMFPFPSAVTLYCCLVVLYSLYMASLLIRHPHRHIMLIAMLRLFVYGANVALCVGYWIAGYVVLGSLALFQYLVTNCLLTAYYAYASVRLKRAAKKELPVNFARTLAYMWLAPATPFAVCALFYVDVHLASTGRRSKSAMIQARIADAVYLYNVQVSIPLLFVQNVYGIALLAAATAFHMPFLVVLFPLLLLFIAQLVYTVEQYVNEYQRWMRRKPFLEYCEKQQKAPSCGGCLLLSSALEFMFEGNDYRDCLLNELQANALVYYCNASMVSPASVRRGSGWGTEMNSGLPSASGITAYEHGMAMLRQQRSASGSPMHSITFHEPGSRQEETVYFPSLTSRSPSHRRPSPPQQTPSAQRRSRRRDIPPSTGTSPTEESTAATDYTTPSRAPEEYWPDSIER